MGKTFVTAMAFMTLACMTSYGFADSPERAAASNTAKQEQTARAAECDSVGTHSHDGSRLAKKADKKDVSVSCSLGKKCSYQYGTVYCSCPGYDSGGSAAQCKKCGHWSDKHNR